MGKKQTCKVHLLKSTKEGTGVRLLHQNLQEEKDPRLCNWTERGRCLPVVGVVCGQ